MRAKRWRQFGFLGFLACIVSSPIAFSAGENSTTTVGSSSAATKSASVAKTEGPANTITVSNAAASRATAAANPAAYLPAQTIPPELADPAFDRYVDLGLLARAWQRHDASLMADVAIQVAEGERILQRRRRALSAATLLELSARIATDSHDKALLERLGQIADSLGQTALKAQLAAALKLGGEARAIDPGATVSVHEMSPRVYREFHRLKRQIEAARIGENADALDRLQRRLAGEKQLPEKHRRYLDKLIGESRTALAAHPQRQSSIVLMDKLVAAGNGGARSSDSDIAALLGNGAIPKDLADPAFDRYVDLHLLGMAWNTGNAMQMTDVALQLLEGQRILHRPHRAISSRQVLETAARVAIEKHDAPTLERLAKLSEQPDDAGWRGKVAAALKLGGAARAINPALTFSVDEMSPAAYSAIHTLLEQIENARAARNGNALESLKQRLADNRDIPSKQRGYLEQLLADSASSLKGVTDPQEDALAEAMNKLGAASRGGHGHGGGRPSRPSRPVNHPHPNPPHPHPHPHPHPTYNPPPVYVPIIVNNGNSGGDAGDSGDTGYSNDAGDSSSDASDSSADSGEASSSDLYAAIAYSPSTGNYASTTKAGSQEEAQTACLNACNADDAVVVTWCKNAFCALAVGSDGSYGAAWANTQADAESQALAACNQDASPNIVASVGAGDG
jgi:hypothetical protein